MNKIELLELKELVTDEPSIIVGDNSILSNKLKFNYSNIEEMIYYIILSYNKNYVHIIINFLCKIVKLSFIYNKND